MSDWWRDFLSGVALMVISCGGVACALLLSLAVIGLFKGLPDKLNMGPGFGIGMVVGMMGSLPVLFRIYTLIQRTMR